MIDYKKYKEICDDLERRLAGVATFDRYDEQNFNERVASDRTVSIWLDFANSIIGKAFYACFPYRHLAHSQLDTRMCYEFNQRNHMMLTLEGRESAFDEMLEKIDELVDSYIENNATQQNGRYANTLEAVSAEKGIDKLKIDTEIKRRFSALGEACKAVTNLQGKHALCVEIKTLYNTIRNVEHLRSLVSQRRFFPELTHSVIPSQLSPRTVAPAASIFRAVPSAEAETLYQQKDAALKASQFNRSTS